MDRLGVRAGLEGEVFRDQGWARIPAEARDIGRAGGIASIDDHQLAGEGLLALLDPNLPILVALAEGVMVRGGPTDGGGPDQEAGGHLLGSRAIGLAPPEEILGMQCDAVFFVR